MAKAITKFGIVIPCFNSASTLRASIDSVLNQGHDSVDIIVIDGASQDNTLEILKSYGNKIRWVSEKDNGQTDAINKGFRQLDAEITTWLNADDRLLDGSLAKVDKYFQDYPNIDFVYGDIEFIDMNGQLLSRRYEPSFSKFVLIYGHNLFADPTCFWRSDVLEKVGLLDIKMEYSMDYEFWFRCADANIKFGQIRSCLAQFAIGQENKSIYHFDEMRQEHFDITVKRRKWLKYIPQNARPMALEFLLQSARILKIIMMVVERKSLPRSRFSKLTEDQ